MNEMLSQKRLVAEFKRMMKEFPPGKSPVKWRIIENDLRRYEVKIRGKPGTPYEGGVFRMRIELPEEYPMKPPIVNALTKIWHPNIAVDRQYKWGSNVCHSLINWDNIGKVGGWKPTIFLPTVVEHLEMMLELREAENNQYPLYIVNPDDPFNLEAGLQLKKDYKKFEKKAKEWTKKYATEE